MYYVPLTINWRETEKEREEIKLGEKERRKERRKNK